MRIFIYKRYLSLLILSSTLLFFYSCGSCGSDEESVELSGTISDTFLDDSAKVSDIIQRSDEYNPYLDVDYLEKDADDPIDVPDNLILRSDSTSGAGIVLRNDITDPLPEPLPVEMLAIKVVSSEVSDSSPSFFAKGEKSSNESAFTYAKEGGKFTLNLDKSKKYKLSFYIPTETEDIFIGALTEDSSTVINPENESSTISLGELSLNGEEAIAENPPEMEKESADGKYISCENDINLLLLAQFTSEDGDYGLLNCSNSSFSTTYNLTLTDGIVGNGAYSDGNSQMLLDLKSLSVSDITGLTIMVWIKLDGAIPSGTSYYVVNGDTFQLKLGKGAGANSVMPVFRVTNTELDEYYTISTNEELTLDSSDFTFIAMRFVIEKEFPKMHIFINGEIANGLDIAEIDSIPNNWPIGSGDTINIPGEEIDEFNRTFKGYIDEVAIILDDVSDTRIKEIYDYVIEQKE